MSKTTDTAANTPASTATSGTAATVGTEQETARAPRHGTFGPASEQPYRRRTSDWLRFWFAFLLVVATAFHFNDLTESERDLFVFFNTLPDALSPVFVFLYRFGTLWAVGLIGVAALVARRWRLARDLVLSGFGAWFIGRMLGVMLVQHESLGAGLKVVTRAGNSPSYPVVRLAVIVAVISAASPYLTRPTRRVGQLTVLFMAAASLYLGTGFPNDVFAAIVLGWGVAAAVHLIFGSPGGRPTRAQVGAALAELGIDARNVELTHAEARGGTFMVAEDDDGPLRVRVLGRDEADAQLLAKFWRFLFYKDGGPTLHLTRLEDVEHEAYTLLLADRADVPVPPVVVAGTAGPGAALLVVRPADGTRLADVEPDHITDDVLADLWQAVQRLHAAHIAHGLLNTQHVVLGAGGIVVIDFTDATAASTPDQRRADVAELLVSLSELVGTERAVRAALAVLGKDTLAEALPFLQTAALSHDMRPIGRRARSDLKKLLGDGARHRVHDRRRGGTTAPAARARRHDEPAHGGRHADRGLRVAEPGR